jgi:1,4-dihydroxy-2-naphthoyl-CoA synthase
MTTAEAPAPPQLETISIDVDGDIGTLTLNRPKVLNAMSPELIGELVTAAGWLADRATLRGLIVTGAGRASSAAWRSRGSTCPRTFATEPRCSTRRSSTSGASRIR